ncbi:hypothetical protein M5K25_006973 [Dendrobium thyrsiflorum]|uniref:Uncharacterized protein n=1 Tax=Dendrobium thyrsiflorum TaxID=117978 RepID=A0ABD0VK61_DENTH
MRDCSKFAESTVAGIGIVAFGTVLANSGTVECCRVRMLYGKIFGTVVERNSMKAVKFQLLFSGAVGGAIDKVETMAAKKVDALEERLEGEMNQIKTTVEERMSSMEGQVADLRDMIKKMLEVHNQTTASVARNGEGRSTNSEIRKEEEEAEISSSAFINVVVMCSFEVIPGGGYGGSGYSGGGRL